jgi:parallel beta-helix repeat protein
MTEIRKSKIYILILLMLLLPLISPLFSTILDVNEDKNNLPKSSGFWIMGPLHIDDTGGGDYTWATAVLQDWCSGNGTLLNPYLLENITIDAGWLDNGILIENSNNKYFTIRNCTVMNAGTGSMANAGIKLLYSSNGTLIENNCLNNIKNGIMLQYGNYNFITNNYIYNSSHTSVRLYQSDHNEVLGNNITEGFTIFSTGIYIDFTSEFNFVSDNDVSNQRTGIVITGSAASNNTIVNNWLFNNSVYGIQINTGCNNNTIELNEIQNSSYGLHIIGDGNTLYRNILINNTQNAVDWGDYNHWDNGTIGNYWDDYADVDGNDDGIGDSPYSLPGSAGSHDNFPIWDDGDDINPTISINTPSGGSLFRADGPTYNLNIFDLNLHMSWYTLNNTATRYFFTPTNGVNVVAIDETGWDTFSSGPILMTFYVNDSAGNPGSVSNLINKDAILPTITVNSPLGGATFGSDAPVFNLTIFDLNLFEADYVITPSLIGDAFTPVNGMNIVPIDEVSWDVLAEGSYTFTFSVTDTAGNVRVVQVIINKELPSSPPAPGIPFGDYYLLFIGIGIVSVILFEYRKRR